MANPESSKSCLRPPQSPVRMKYIDSGSFNLFKHDGFVNRPGFPGAVQLPGSISSFPFML